MKKLITILLCAALVLCIAACGGPTEPTGTQAPTGSETNQEPSFTFTYKGTEIALHAPAEPIIAALGEPKSYSESTSCAFEGLDKSYGYGSFYLETYPKGDKDFVYGWWFVDDMVETEEGICIGSSQADVEKAYGSENFNGSNSFVIKRGSGVLTIILDKGAVSSIQYTIVSE
jgi:hypothetical protein